MCWKLHNAVIFIKLFLQLCGKLDCFYSTRNTFCGTQSLSNASFSFLITWRSPSLKSAAVYKFHQNRKIFCRAMLCTSAAIAGMWCLSVRPSVTFVSCAKTNKDIFKIFSPSGSHTILVYPYQTGWRYSDGNSPNGDVKCKGVWKNDDFRPISLYLRNGYSKMGTCSKTICKHQILFPSMQHLAWLPQGRPQGKQKCGKKSDFWTYALT